LNHDIIAIGGSAGSGTVLKRLVRDLPADFEPSVFVTTHIPADGSMLPDLLAEGANLPVLRAVDGMPVEPGRIYIAPADRHMLLVDSTVRLGHGPRENMSRPAIDPMFRSAAYAYGPRVIGVVLSGYLNDGASGLHAIKQCGGLTVVQHPVDAHAEQMPRSALEAVEVDHVATAANMAELLGQLAKTPAEGGRAPTRELELEIRIAAGARVSGAALRSFAEPSAISCPDCHGVLSEVKVEGPLRYRCQIGHAYTAEVFMHEQQGQVDEALSVALRLMEERLTLVERMAEEAHQQGRNAVAELYGERAEEYRGHVETLRRGAVLAMVTSRQPAEEEAG